MRSYHILVALDGAPKPRQEALSAGNPVRYLRAFLNDIAGTPRDGELDTQAVVQAVRTALTIQQVTDGRIGHTAL